MSGRREQQKRDRERRILRAGGHLFEKPGYAATRMGQIAARAGLAVGTLYNYFPSKSEIALAIVRGEMSGALDAGEAVLAAPPPDPVAAACSLLDLYLEPFEHQPRALWRELMAAAIAEPGGFGARFFAEDLRLISQLASLLRTLQARGDLGADLDAGRAAIALYGAYIGWVMAFLANTGLDAKQLRKEVHAAVGIAMGGMLRRDDMASKRRKGDTT